MLLHGGGARFSFVARVSRFYAIPTITHESFGTRVHERDQPERNGSPSPRFLPAEIRVIHHLFIVDARGGKEVSAELMGTVRFGDATTHPSTFCAVHCCGRDDGLDGQHEKVHAEMSARDDVLCAG